MVRVLVFMVLGWADTFKNCHLLQNICQEFKHGKTLCTDNDSMFTYTNLIKLQLQKFHKYSVATTKT